MTAFIIWSLVGLGFTVMGICTLFATKPVGFWANEKMFEVTDVKRYNRAAGWLWILFGAIFALLGIPLLKGQNSATLLIPVLGVMLEVIVCMAVYLQVIEKKYRKRG